MRTRPAPVLFVLLAGCGGSSSTPPAAPTTRAAAGTPHADALPLPSSAAGPGTIPVAPIGPGVPAPAGTLRFLALGDSYTIGEAVDPPDRWPVQLAAALRVRGHAFADPTIVAQTGWTTDELAANGIAKAKLTGPYDLVSLLIGVNNQFRKRDVEEYRTQFVSLLKQAVGFAGGSADRVIVVSFPDWTVTPMAKRLNRNTPEESTAVDRFNAVNKDEAKKAGARYVEITVASRKAAADPNLLADDGLHPSGLMYKAWAEAALPEALAALKSK